MWEFIAGAVIMAIGVIVGYAISGPGKNSEPVVRVVNMPESGNVKMRPRGEDG